MLHPCPIWRQAEEALEALQGKTKNHDSKVLLCLLLFCWYGRVVKGGHWALKGEGRTMNQRWALSLGWWRGVWGGGA